MRVGIIVNPSSGRDIRRLLARASVFPTGEKINVVLRLLASLGALGVGEALIMPEGAGIAAAVAREAAAEGRRRGRPLPDVRPLAMAVTETAEDTARAVRLMCEADVGAIAILGGDGTHRVAAAHCGDTPLLALSTGTNNAFPELREATTAGLAMGLAVAGAVPPAVALRRNKLLRVRYGERHELALVDVCVARQPFLGARAVWQPSDLSRLFVTFAEPRGIGLSAIAGWCLPVARAEPWGAQLAFGPGGHV
ncbi:MAG TPA: NAD(+)/NADH kinase, partial [Chloroflexaceae bacterium]|nr:NAD(+)/NADH kinase [Chloroflexaceae bacterium]